MRKFKTLFIIALIIDLIASLPIVLIKLMPEMADEMVFSQFPGINDPGKEALMTIFDVFGVISASMIIAVAVATTIKEKSTAKMAALILFIFHVGWILMDWINFLVGKGGPPLAVLLLSSLAALALGYAWKKGEI